jgi:predicted N-formylglutamate amidohydrolase
VSDNGLLSDDEPPVFTTERTDARSPFLITCDHGSARIPRKLARLGLSEAELSTHIAFDLGVAALGRRLAARLDAFLIVHNYSRLVIDMNRPPGAPDSIVTRSERTRIAANDGLSAAEVARRTEEMFEPYHARIRAELDQRREHGRPVVLVALHTFTPVFLDVARLWHAGVLYGRDSRFAHRVLAALRSEAGLVVGDNEPYSVDDDTDYTVVVHGERRAILHVELEIRQDLLTTDDELDAWASRLASALERAAIDLPPESQARASTNAAGESDRQPHSVRSEPNQCR